MKLTEAEPSLRTVQRYINRYQFFDIEDPSFLKTIPNGKIDLYTILEGGFDIWDPVREKFQQAPESGYLPATNTPALLKISENLVCMNIKLNLNVLALPWFRDVYSGDFVHEFETGICEIIRSLNKVNGLMCSGELQVNGMDEQLADFFASEPADQNVMSIMNEVEEMDQFSVVDLAKKLNISPRTLNRLTRKYFKLSPKDLATILRFERTTSYLKENESEGLIEALSFGYYDQSHFIKECRKITGTSPKKLFGKMKLPTNDLLVGNNPGVFTGP